MQKPDFQFVGPRVAVIALFGFSLAYYLRHPIFSLQEFSSITAKTLDFFLILAILVVAGSIGARLFSNLRANPLSRFAIRGAVGLFVLALGTFLGGSVFGLSRPIIWIFLSAMLAYLAPSARLWIADLVEFKQIWQDANHWLKTILVFIGIIFSFAVLNSLLPPIKYDALVYHLALPEIYLANGQIAYVAENVLWGFPQLTQMLYTLALTLGAGNAALIGVFVGFLAIIGLAGQFSEWLGSNFSGWVAPAALLSGTSLAESLAWGYVDWSSLLVGWVILYSLSRYIKNNTRDWLLILSIAAGSAIGVKYPAAFLAVVAFLILVIRAKANRRDLFIYLGLTLAISIAWILPNVIHTGNPIYPMLFAGGEIDTFRLQATQTLPAQFDWVDFFLLPIQATLFGIEGARIGDAPGYEASLGPALLVFSIFAWIGHKNLKKPAKEMLVLLTFISVGTWLVWGMGAKITGHLARTHLYYFAFPAIAGLAAFGFEQLRKTYNLNIVVPMLTVMLGISVLSISNSAIQGKVISSFLADEPDNYLRQNLGIYSLATQYIKEELASDSRVLMLWEARSYYCTLKCDPDEIQDHWRDMQHRKTAEQSAQDYWLELGYSHVLYHRQAAQFIAQDPEHFLNLELEQVESSLSTFALIVDFNDAYLLYELQK